MLSLLVALSLCAGPKVDQRLVGTWLVGGEPFLTLNANGSGSMEGDPVKWTADGKTLVVTGADGETDRGRYVVEGDAMTLIVGEVPLSLTRAGGKKPAPSPEAVAPPPQQQQPQRAGTDQLSRLLLSSAWCTFRYSKVSDTTSQSRVQFFPNGTWSMSARSESYNSGPNGSVFGSNSSGEQGQWQVKNGVLHLSEGAGPLVPVEGFSVTRNSNGSPIINADGKEYMLCQ